VTDITSLGSIGAIARSGMDVEWQRVEVIAQNLANASTTRTATGRPYVPLHLVSGPALPASISPKSGVPLMGVQVYGIEETESAPRIEHDPSHPHADANGNVAYPSIDQAGEMTSLIRSQRVYEANVAVFNLARAMYARALDIGSKS